MIALPLPLVLLLSLGWVVAFGVIALAVTADDTDTPPPPLGPLSCPRCGEPVTRIVHSGTDQLGPYEFVTWYCDGCGRDVRPKRYPLHVEVKDVPIIDYALSLDEVVAKMREHAKRTVSQEDQ